jgi:predicted neuraminidase
MEPNVVMDQRDNIIVQTDFVYQAAPFPACHASTIEESNDRLIVAWFGGTHEKHPDVGIWVARRESDRWTTPVEVADGVQGPALRYPCWNPVLFQPKMGPLLLFYKVGPDPSNWWGMLKRSGDGGRTWSKPERLPDGILGPIKNKPVQLAGGAILCPSSDESNEETGWRVHFERTSDGGRTWQATGPVVSEGNAIGAIQPSILVHGPNHLQAVGRTQQGKVFTTQSTDDGKTWSAMTFLDLPNPNSGTDAVTLRGRGGGSDARFLLVYNHTLKGRNPLNVAVSQDGKTWERALTLEDTPGGGEFSYPAVIQTRDGLVHITYTWLRQRIKHVVVDPTKLRDGR